MAQRTHKQLPLPFDPATLRQPIRPALPPDERAEYKQRWEEATAPKVEGPPPMSEEDIAGYALADAMEDRRYDDPDYEPVDDDEGNEE